MTEGTALLLVDVIASFFQPGMPNFYPEAAKVLDPLRRLARRGALFGVLDRARRGAASPGFPRFRMAEAAAAPFRRRLVPREATNSNRPHLAAASLEDIDRYFGRVASLDEALAALA